MLRQDIGEFVKRRRETALISQEELALRSDVTVRTIWALEAGGTVPQFKTLRKLAAALDIRPEEFLEQNEVAS